MNILEQHNEASKRYYQRNREHILAKMKSKSQQAKAERLRQRIIRLQNELESLES